ncbi:hypothetical protein P4O66_014368, partial [Electrophorus voltai]
KDTIHTKCTKAFQLLPLWSPAYLSRTRANITLFQSTWKNSGRRQKIGMWKDKSRWIQPSQLDLNCSTVGSGTGLLPSTLSPLIFTKSSKRLLPAWESCQSIPGIKHLPVLSYDQRHRRGQACAQQRRSRFLRLPASERSSLGSPARECLLKSVSPEATHAVVGHAARRVPPQAGLCSPCPISAGGRVWQKLREAACTAPSLETWIPYKPIRMGSCGQSPSRSARMGEVQGSDAMPLHTGQSGCDAPPCWRICRDETLSQRKAQQANLRAPMSVMGSGLKQQSEWSRGPWPYAHTHAHASKAWTQPYPAW